MNKHPLSLAGVMLAMAAALSAQAADAPRCNELLDDMQRLACYDAAFGKPVRSGTSSAPVAPVSTVAAPVVPAAAAAVVVAPQAAPKAQAAAPVAAAPLPETIKASVASLSHAADGRFIATLDNGQVWLQLERDTRAEVKIGEAVTLHRMLFGNYTMITSTGYSIRAKRVE